MGTSGAYGGSSSAAWEAVREQWTGLGDAGAPGGPDGPPPPTDPSPDAPPDPAYDGLGTAIGAALAPPQRYGQPPALSSLLPRPRGGGGGGGEAGGSGGSGSDGYGGRTGGRSGRNAPLQAARGGAAIGAATSYRDRNAAALAGYGVTLDELDRLSPRMRTARLLDLVLGDAGHPDEAMIRKAAAEQVKKILDPNVVPPTAAESVREFIGEITMQYALVELKDQILSGATTGQQATYKENGLRGWIRGKLRGLDLGKYGAVTATTCHAVAHGMWRDALKLIAPRTS